MPHAVLRISRACVQECVVKQLFRRFLKDETGATAVEFGLIAAGISIAILAAMKSIGTNLIGAMSHVSPDLR